MAAKTTHGMTKTRTYRIWQGMRWRCSHDHPDYARRGIKVCDRWQSFENFLADMGEIGPGMSLDRIDNDGNYEPENCRVIAVNDQYKNRRGNRHITIDGVTKTLREWVKETGIPQSTFFNRLKHGWTGERLLAPSSSTRDKPITIGDRTMTVAQFSRETGVCPELIRSRIKRGWPPEQAIQPNGADVQVRKLKGRGIKIHGMTNTRTFRIWQSMRRRCHDHPLYSGKGIKVCERWQSFENFLLDVGEIAPGSRSIALTRAATMSQET